MKQRSALIVGVSGRVGKALARALLADGWSVHGVARFTDPSTRDELQNDGVETHAFDLTKDDPSTLPDVDILFLEVWDSSRSPATLWPLNFHGVGRIVERYAGKADIVNGCTIAVYGRNAEPATEDTPCRPYSEYDRTRYAQERLIDYFCKQRQGRAVHVRYAHANSEDSGILYRLCEDIVRGEPIAMGPDEKIQVIALEDFVRITISSVALVDNPPTLINCCHPRVWTVKELALELHRRIGAGSVEFTRNSGGEEESYYADPSKMIQLFGQPKVPLELLLERVAKQFR